MPLELLRHPLVKDRFYEIVVIHRSGSVPDWVQVVARGGGIIEHYTENGSVNNPAESAKAGMLAVGAAHYWDPHTIADYSSRGPTPDGRTKPDIVGIACGEAASYELEPPEYHDGNNCWFPGTSQAAPHVAGLAALVRQRFPDYTPEQVAGYLKDHAERRGNVPNYTWGYGFAQLPAHDAVAANAPGAPTGLAATASGPTRIDLSWSAPASDGGAAITGYRIEVSTDGSSWSDLVADTNSTATRYSHTGLTLRDTRHYRVSAINSAGISPASNVATATTSSTPSGNVSATRSFSPASVASGGRVVVTIAAANYGSFSAVTETLPQGFTYVSSTLPDGRVTVVDARTVRFTLQRDTSFSYTVTAPSVEGSYTFSGTLRDSNRNDHVVGGAATMTVSSGDPLIARYDTNGNGTIDKSEVIEAINDYLFGTGPDDLIKADVIRLINLYLFGPPPAPAAQPPGAPTGLTATASGPMGIDLSWSAPAVVGAAITGYRLEVSTDGSDWSDLVADTGSPATRYSHTGLTAGSTRHYRVSAINPAGTGPASNVATATTGPAQSAGSPDLVVDTPTVDNSSPAAGASFTLSATVRNRGSGPADSTTLRYYRPTDSTITGGDTSVGTAFVAGLAASGSSNRSISLAAPSISGTYHYGACVDAVAGESDTGNNCSTAVTVTVGPADSAGGEQSDRAALVALYNATGGPDWDRNTNWLSDEPLSAWYGVQRTDNGGRVTHLNLSENGLTGQLPPALGNLSNLEELSLLYNQLTGQLPPELGNLSNLKWMVFHANQLTGQIPPELGNLSNLEELSLTINRLTGQIPPELGNLSNLKRMGLSGNQLTGQIPPELGNLPNLEFLSLHANRLTGQIPPELGNLSNLEFLSLPDNQLTGQIPPELGNLSNLEDLALSENQLTGQIPPELGNLSNLEGLWLLRNQLTGQIPPELGNLSNLKRMVLGDNQLTGQIPPELGNLSNLEYLVLSENQLTGQIPAELGDLANLETLRLAGGNQFTGCVPAALEGLRFTDVYGLGLPFCAS